MAVTIVAGIVIYDPPAAITVAVLPGVIAVCLLSWAALRGNRVAVLLLVFISVFLIQAIFRVREYEDKDVEKSDAARREYQAKGNGYSGVPLVDFGGTIIRGYDEAKLRRLVAERQKAAEAGAQAD